MFVCIVYYLLTSSLSVLSVANFCKGTNRRVRSTKRDKRDKIRERQTDRQLKQERYNFKMNVGVLYIHKI